MIDPVWNDSVANDPAYKQVIVDIYCPESVKLNFLAHRKGMELLSRAIRQVAIHKSPEEFKKPYLQESEDFKDCVTRTIDVKSLGCSYSFVFT